MGKPFKRGPNKAPFLKGGGQVSDQTIDDFPPAFSFEKMQEGSGNSFNCCEDADRLALAKRLFMLSRVPWKEIRQASAKELGSEQIPRYRIKRVIPRVVTEEVESFSSLHFVANKRFIVIVSGKYFIFFRWIIVLRSTIINFSHPQLP
jgi:hypothetical protein